ncbi:MAG: hypothetical protein WCJ30_08565, partial [Deltaproteobacteria bacterium]
MRLPWMGLGSITTMALALMACGPDRNSTFDVATDIHAADSGPVDDLVDSATPDVVGQDVVGQDTVGRDVVVGMDAFDAGPLPPTVDIVVTGAPADAPARFGGT